MKRMLSLVLALALLFILTACTTGSSSTAGNTASEEDISYIGGSKGIFQSQTLDLPGNPSVSYLAFAGDSLILGEAAEGGDRLYRFDMDSQAVYELDAPERLSIVSMDSGPDFQVCILNTEADGSYSIYLVKPDDSLEKLDIPDCRALEDELPSALFMTQGGYLLNTTGHIIALDGEGALLREFDCGSRLLQNYVDVVGSGSDEALALISGERGTDVWVMDEELRIEAKYSFPESYLDFYSGDGNYIYARDTGIIFRLDYRTGDLKLWDEYNIEWVNDTLGTVDFVNGFVEDYNDPLGRKATWEGLVNIKDHEASRRTEIISENAQWFEDNSPVDSRFRKPVVKGVSAKVIDATTLAGDCYPSTPIGINLPNADWIRRDHGSKSVTIANITHAYDRAAQEAPNSTLQEFAWSEEEVAAARKYLSLTDEIHTDLHECLGHGSGQLLPGTSPAALGEYSSTLEETRADLFGLYYIADPKLVELGIMPDAEAYKPQYSNYIRNGLMVQFTRVELGKKNTEAHMQNRKLIAEWCYEAGKDDNVIEKKVRDGKTYFVVNDYEALRELFGRLLAEVQRIKSEGDYAAGRDLVEKYAVNIDPELHKKVLERYKALNLKPYGGFVNPEITPVVKDGKVVDYKVAYTTDYLGQMMEYGRKYSTL